MAEQTRGRPDMLDEHGARRFIHPTEVKGFFQKRRKLVRQFLIGLFLVLPWIKINGEQALLIDIVNRKFSILGQTFFAQDTPLLFLILIQFLLGMALLTALLGRFWCGWLCPQTVYIEEVFRAIERLVEGPAEIRRKNDQEGKVNLPKKALKWLLFTAATLIITHSMLALFMGKDLVLQIIGGSIEAHSTAFIFILISNAVLLFNFGWFREQFCMIACPYGKFQSVFQDRQTVTVAYDVKRGEPRRGLADTDTQGDCVDCYRCVKVCPTGIDIRRGIQLECIACTACMDACDDVMTRMKKPPKLIGYFSETQLNREPLQWIRPRIFIYTFALLFFFITSVYLLSTLKPMDVSFFKTKGEPYRSLIVDNRSVVLNLFSVEISNKSKKPLILMISNDQLTDQIRFILPSLELHIEPGQVISYPMSVEFDPKLLKDGAYVHEVKVFVKDESGKEIWKHNESLRLIGPFN